MKYLQLTLFQLLWCSHCRGVLDSFPQNGGMQECTGAPSIFYPVDGFIKLTEIKGSPGFIRKPFTGKKNKTIDCWNPAKYTHLWGQHFLHIFIFLLHHSFLSGTKKNQRKVKTSLPCLDVFPWRWQTEIWRCADSWARGRHVKQQCYTLYTLPPVFSANIHKSLHL